MISLLRRALASSSPHAAARWRRPLLAALLSPPPPPPGPARRAPALEPPRPREFHGSPCPLGFRATPASPGMEAGVAAGEDGGLEIAKLGISGRIVEKLAARGITRLFPIQGLRHYGTQSSEAVWNLEGSSELDAPKAKRTRSRISKKSGTAMMLPLHFHYEDVLRQDLLLKQNHANIMQVPGLYELRLVPKGGSELRVPIGKLAMEILSGQRFKEVETDPFAKARKSARTNPFLGANRDGSNAFARQSVLRGHAMYNFLVRMLTVMSMLDSRAEVRENTIKFFMETEFCEFSPELEDHFEIFEHIRGFNVTIITSADTKDETSLLWSGFMLNDEGETK